MKYRNLKTGAVIEAGSKLTGEDWEAVKEQPPTSPVRKPRKKKESTE